MSADRRFYLVKDLLDALEHAKYCKEVLYKRMRSDSKSHDYLLICGRFVWQGRVEKGSEDEKLIKRVLEMKGIEIIGIRDIYELEKIVEEMR